MSSAALLCELISIDIYICGRVLSLEDLPAVKLKCAIYSLSAHIYIYINKYNFEEASSGI